MRHAFGRHLHDGLVLSVVDRGSGILWCEGRTYNCPTGSVVIIGPGEVHAGRAKPGSVLRYRTVSIGPELLQSLSPEWSPGLEIRDRVPRDRELAIAIRRLVGDLARPAAARPPQASLGALLERIAARYAVPRAAGLRPAITAAKAYLEANERENVSLRELAAAVGLNPSYLNRVFSRTVGLPPHAYQVQRRLLASRSLLARGIPPSVAARAAGFYDQSHLSRHFRRAFGMAPGGVGARI